MKKTLFLIIIFLLPNVLFAQNEIEPDGDKLLIILIVIVLVLIALFVFGRKKKEKKSTNIEWTFFQKKLNVKLEKDALYYPDTLKLSITNTRNKDVDLDNPMLVFDNFWLKRKFKLKGMGNRKFYPLFLEKGKTHTLEIDLNRFYFHDKSLKKYPKAKVILSDVNGRKLGSRSVFLRKTLIKY